MHSVKLSWDGAKCIQYNHVLRNSVALSENCAECVWQYDYVYMQLKAPKWLKRKEIGIVRPVIDILRSVLHCDMTTYRPTYNVAVSENITLLKRSLR